MKRLVNGGTPPDRNPKKIQRFAAKPVVQPKRTKTTNPTNKAYGCLRYLWIPHPTRRSRAVGPALGMTTEAGMKAPVKEMYAGEDQSWQDVYASYGCSLDFDVSDDDG